jgi:hypothetical protein
MGETPTEIKSQFDNIISAKNHNKLHEHFYLFTSINCT